MKLFYKLPSLISSIFFATGAFASQPSNWNKLADLTQAEGDFVLTSSPSSVPNGCDRYLRLRLDESDHGVVLGERAFWYDPGNEFRGSRFGNINLGVHNVQPEFTWVPVLGTWYLDTLKKGVLTERVIADFQNHQKRGISSQIVFTQSSSASALRMKWDGCEFVAVSPGQIQAIALTKMAAVIDGLRLSQKSIIAMDDAQISFFCKVLTQDPEFWGGDPYHAFHVCEKSSATANRESIRSQFDRAIDLAEVQKLGITDPLKAYGPTVPYAAGRGLARQSDGRCLFDCHDPAWALEDMRSNYSVPARCESLKARSGRTSCDLFADVMTCFFSCSHRTVDGMGCAAFRSALR